MLLLAAPLLLLLLAACFYYCLLATPLLLRTLRHSHFEKVDQMADGEGGKRNAAGKWWQSRAAEQVESLRAGHIDREAEIYTQSR